MNIIKEAWKIADKVHKNQKRFNGQPYINHIKDCIRIFDETGIKDKKIELLLILHDVLEDGGNKKDLSFLPVTEYNDLLLLKHEGGLTTYQNYIDLICKIGKTEVIYVKLIDMIQNVTEDPKKKQREKYRVALPKLIKALSEV